jgi:hypothetical protein
MGIGSDKSAATEENPSEISGNYDTYIGKFTLTEYVKYGDSSRSLWFAVVGITGNIRVTQDICVDVVLGFAMVRFY